MFLKLYLIALPIFFAIDLLWLGMIAKSFYQKQIGHLLSENVNWLAALVFYLIFLFGLVVFVIEPAIEKKSLRYALEYGALFGFVTYSAYDLTNLAVTKDWSLTVTFVDLMWGAALSLTVASLTYIVATRWM